MEHQHSLSLILNSKPKLHWAAIACLLLIMQSTALTTTALMKTSVIFQSVSLLHYTATPTFLHSPKSPQKVHVDSKVDTIRLMQYAVIGELTIMYITITSF